MTASKAQEITARLMEPFPVDVIEEKNGLLYIPHEIIRERLISATANQFDWSIDQVLFRDDGVTRRANDRYTGEPRRPLSMLVLGTLTIPGLGSRAGIGAHPLDEGAGEDAAYKSAESDAFKRAAMAFGVGLQQLYIETGNAKRVSRPQRAPVRAINRGAEQETVAADKRFGAEVREAMAARDADLFRKLVGDANDNQSRWIALVQAAESPQALDWIKRQIERKGLGNDILDRELRNREEQLAA
jgi:hypothetical protein